MRLSHLELVMGGGWRRNKEEAPHMIGPVSEAGPWGGGTSLGE